MLKPAVLSGIESAVRMTLAPLLVTSVSVTEGEDYDAHDVLFVTINLPSGTGQIPGDRMLNVMTAASEAALRLGEERPPYFRTLRDGETELDEVDALN